MIPAVAPSTRDALVSSAIDLVQEVGWAGLNLRDLAARVGIRAPSIHHHFATKTDLGLACLAFLRQERETHSAALVADHGDVRQRLLALGDLIAEKLDTETRSCPIYAFQAEFAILPPPMQAEVSGWIEDVLAMLTRWFAEGRAAGQLSFPGTDRDQALVTWSVLQQGTQLRRTHPDTDFTALVRHLVAAVSV